MPPHPIVDFEAVRENALKDGIHLSEISIVYESLTPEELTIMNQAGLVAHGETMNVIGRFGVDGQVLFPEKATAVPCLSGG